MCIKIGRFKFKYKMIIVNSGNILLKKRLMTGGERFGEIDKKECRNFIELNLILLLYKGV